MIDSSAPAADPVAEEDASPVARYDALRATPPASWRESVVVAVAVGAVAALMFATHRAGHWWGDDWALYLRQATSLLDGNPGRITADNEFAVLNTLGPPFSPPLYPWGFPIVLVPFVAVLGTDVDRLAMVPVLSACAFACGWYVLGRPRLGRVAAGLGAIAITLSPTLLGWTELIQSEWTFMAVTIWALVALDRAANGPGLLAARWGTLAGIGALAAASFSVRREGLALIAAIAAAQLVALAIERPALRTRLVVVLAVPHAVAGVVVWTLQAVLPSTVIPRYSGTGLHNIWGYRRKHVEHLVELVGIKRPWDEVTVVLGSEVLGVICVVVFMVLAVVGLVHAATRMARRDLHLATYAFAAFVIGASFRSALNRYVCTVAPLLLLFAAVAVVELGRRLGRDRLGRAILAICLLAVVAGDVANANVRLGVAADRAASGAIEWGPTHPAAIEMFAEVRRRTDPDDVVAGPKARAMIFGTDRRAVQVDAARPIPDIELALVVAETGSAIAKELDADPGRYELVWSNSRFVMYAPR